MTIQRGVAETAAEIRDGHAADADLGVGVQVPATSANLGPGYDALGLALDIPFVAVSGPRQDRRVISSGFGGEELPTGEDNLVWRGVLAWCEETGAAPPEVSIHVRSAIPLERGLGSSSAAAVAGLALARTLTGGPGGADVLLRLATELEGHPDNAAAAIVGGLTVCLGGGRFRRVSPSDALQPIVLIPAERQATAQARAVLPSEVPLAVAAANGARVAATFAGLAGLVPLHAEDMTDGLHEPARLQIMGTSRALVEGLRGRGVAAALSGAGPSVLAVVARGDEVAVQTVRDVAGEVGEPLEIVPARWDLAGVQVCPPTS